MVPSRFIFLAGAVPFLFLGTVHAFATPLTLQSRKGLAPRDPALGEAMSKSGLLLTSRTDVWRCWIGFNFSHSLGLGLVGVVVVLIGWSEAGYTFAASVAVPLAALSAAAYLTLALKYWFRAPVVWLLFGLLCFAVSWGLLSLGH